jgi:uncharacterized integral membrane protein
LVVLVIVVAFAVANRGPVTISLYPLPFIQEVPAFLPILGAFAAGILLGGFYYWLSASRWRWRARADERRIETLERKMSDPTVEERRLASGALTGPRRTDPAQPRIRAAVDDE